MFHAIEDSFYKEHHFFADLVGRWKAKDKITLWISLRTTRKSCGGSVCLIAWHLHGGRAPLFQITHCHCRWHFYYKIMPSAKVLKYPKVARSNVPTSPDINIYVKEFLWIIFVTMILLLKTHEKDDVPCVSHLASVTLLWQNHGYVIKIIPDKCSQQLGSIGFHSRFLPLQLTRKINISQRKWRQMPKCCIDSQ